MRQATNGEKLRNLYLEQGFATRAEFARKLQGDRASPTAASWERMLKRWEKGTGMDESQRTRVAEALNISPAELIDHTSPESRRQYITECITLKNKREEELFGQSIPIYESLFPEDERDSIDDIREWIKESRDAEEKNEPEGDPWRDVYYVFHNHKEVIGMAFFTAHLHFLWVFGGYWGIAEGKTGEGRERVFLEAIEAHLKKKVLPGLKAIVFEIAWVDIDYLQAVVDRGEPYEENLADALEAVERLRLFQRSKESLPVVSNKRPFPYFQPALEEPFNYEKPMILMVRKQRGILWKDIGLEGLLTFIYDYVYHDAFAPEIGAIQKEGFEANLASVSSCVKSAAQQEWNFAPLQMPKGIERVRRIVQPRNKEKAP